MDMVHRGFYMLALVLLNLLNKLRKKDKTLDKPRIFFSLFLYSFNRFNTM